MKTIEQILNHLTAAVTVATVVRIALYRLPDLLQIYIPADRPFWLSYGRLVQSVDVILGWLSGALAKFGKSQVLTTEHQEWLRDKTPPPPVKPPIATLDAAKEEPEPKVN